MTAMSSTMAPEPGRERKKSARDLTSFRDRIQLSAIARQGIVAPRGAPPKKVEAWATQYQKAKKATLPCWRRAFCPPDRTRAGRGQDRTTSRPVRAQSPNPSRAPALGALGGLVVSDPRIPTIAASLSLHHRGRQPTGRRCAARRGGGHGRCELRARPRTAPLVKEGLSESWR